MSDFVWLRFPETGGVNRFPVDAAPGWRARGWVDTEEPVPVDPARAHQLVAEEPAPPAVTDQPTIPAVTDPPADSTPKTTPRRSAGTSTEVQA